MEILTPINGMNFWHESSSGLWRGSRGRMKRASEEEKKKKLSVNLHYDKRTETLNETANLNLSKSYKPKSAVARAECRDVATRVSQIWIWNSVTAVWPFSFCVWRSCRASCCRASRALAPPSLPRRIPAPDSAGPPRR